MRTITNAMVLATLLLFCRIPVFSQQVAKLIPNAVSPDGHIGFLEFKPTDYGSQKHPLIVFLHGIGERGNGTTQVNSVAANAIPKFCAAGATMRFTVGGLTSSFVVLSPQLSTSYGSWPSFYVTEMIKYAKANLQIDTNRIYVTGLSLGGGGVWRAITQVTGGDYSFDAGIAAAAPCCGTQDETDANMCSTIAANHLPVWAFHCMDDGTVPVNCTQHAQIVLSWCSGMTPAAKFTYYQSGGHSGAWINAFDTGHITRTVSGGGSFTASPNLYEWFLSHTRATAPVANAGPPQIISYTTTDLDAAGSYSPNGSITAYNWQQVSGPSAATIVNGNAPVVTISNMIEGGSYSFQLTITDVIGASGSAVTGITVTNVLLPVQFSYLKAQQTSTGNILQWAVTAGGQNNDYFSVEKSIDRKQFINIGKVAATGYSKAGTTFTYTDTKPDGENVYYRIRAVDKAGKSTFSQLILVSENSSVNAVKIYPAPVQDNLHIFINNEINGNGQIMVYGLTGRCIRQQFITKNDKVLNAVVDMNNLLPGPYIVQVKIGDAYSFTKSVLKK